MKEDVFASDYPNADYPVYVVGQKEVVTPKKLAKLDAKLDEYKLAESKAVNETGSRSPCMRPRSDPPKMKNSNVVRSRLIILINKQHTQFGVSTSDGSRDIAATKLWRKKKINK